MDCYRRAGSRVCLTYLVSFVLLSVFFYYLMAYNGSNKRGIIRLQEDLDHLSHMLRKQQVDCKEAHISQHDTNERPKAIASGRCDKRDVTEYVDTLIKRKIGHLMDDVYNLKNQIINADCMARKEQPISAKEFAHVVPNRINFACEAMGARIIHVIARPIGGTNMIKRFLGLEFSANPPVNMLRPSLAPGACFGFSGSQATVVLHLAKPILVEAIALTHVSREMTPSVCVDSAPKDFDVSKRNLLGQLTFNNDANRRTQTYNVNSNSFYPKLVLAFRSNHGANSTCIYRLEVYGRPQ
ncbi:SUN domain-containing protein 3 isoform X2 [Drosophila kikkawai]|uniref:SUN domain-containing protein 3 isoform X2 n=1 Tax=Drosophila kikkawai TaxID=30033 RepID=A0ABM4GBR9_DROKI